MRWSKKRPKDGSRSLQAPCHQPVCLCVAISVALRGCCSCGATATREDRQEACDRGCEQKPSGAGCPAYLLCLHHILGHHEGGEHPELLGPCRHVAVHPLQEAGTLQYHRQVLCASCGGSVPKLINSDTVHFNSSILHFQHAPVIQTFYFCFVCFPRLFNWLNLKTELGGDNASKYLSILQREEHLQYSRIHDCFFKR